MSAPTRAPASRTCFCRACDETIRKPEERIGLHSFRNRGQAIYFCLPCARAIGKLAAG